LENKIPIFNEIYKRINPSDTTHNNPYIIKKQLGTCSDNDQIHYYHPYIPFDVENSMASSWLSWCNVQIRGENGVLGKEETVQLLRVRSGTDMKDFTTKLTDDILVIDAPFPSNSIMNWSNWLKHAETPSSQISPSKQILDEVISIISSLSSNLNLSNQVLNKLNSLVDRMEFKGMENNGLEFPLKNTALSEQIILKSRGDPTKINEHFDFPQNSLTPTGKYI
jgi:hypothetical protein